MPRKSLLLSLIALGALFALWFATPRATSRTQITYYRDAAPILARHCVRCHSEGGLAAFPRLDQYDSIVRFQGKIRYMVWTRAMPPWLADNTGICGKWKDALWLSNEEIQTLVSWFDGGVLLGEPREVPPPTQVASALQHVDAVIDTGASFQSGLVDRAYRCFVGDPGLTSDRLLSAIRVSSTDPRMVTQISLFSLESEEAEIRAAQLDADAPGPGYPCYGSPRAEPSRLVASWTWDAPILRFPTGTGVRVHAHRKFVVQIHYDTITSGQDVATHTRIELQLDERGREASLLRIAPPSFSLPPERQLTSVSGEMTVSRSMTLWGIAPRMHTRGKTLQVDFLGADGSSCLGAFEHWNFFRQRLFEFAEPKRLQRGDRLRVACAYNTMSREVPTLSGDDITDEDCSAYVYMTDE